MTVTVETLEKLERTITLTLPAGRHQRRSRVAPASKLARTVKADGFRPGKVPMSVVAQRYGYSVQYEVMNDKVGEAFSQRRQRSQAARGRPARITEKDEAPEGELAFDATFEVYPDVKIGDLSNAEVETRDGRSRRRRDRQDPRHPAQAAPHLRAAPGRRRRRRTATA